MKRVINKAFCYRLATKKFLKTKSKLYVVVFKFKYLNILITFF